MKEKAARVAAETPAYDSNGGYCEAVAYTTGIGAIVLGFATDGGSVAAWVGVFGGSVGTGSFADSC
jgi:hypothetical protein